MATNYYVGAGAVCNMTSDRVYFSVSTGSCTFTNNDTCGYTLNSPWEVAYGETSFSVRPHYNLPLLYHGAFNDTSK